MITLILPLPPTINHYYGQARNRRYIKAAGIAFRSAVAEIVAEAGHATIDGRVSVFGTMFFATKHRQDLDNRIKALQDALTHAGVWLDDEQIDDLHIVRGCVYKGGKTIVVITELPAVKTKAAN